MSVFVSYVRTILPSVPINNTFLFTKCSPLVVCSELDLAQ